MKRTYRLIPLLIILFLVLGAAGWCAHALLFTGEGAKWLLQRALWTYVSPQNLSFGEVEGNVFDGWTYRNLEARSPEKLPRGSVVKVQLLTVRVTALNYHGISLKIENARLQMPLSENIVFSGELAYGFFNVNVFTRSLDVAEVVAFLPVSQKFKGIRGHVDAVDLYIKGDAATPDITGTFHVDRIVRQNVALVNVPGEVNLKLRQPTQRWTGEGEIRMTSGQFETPHSEVTLLPGKVSFPPNNESVALDLRGKATIEKTDIDIILKGTFKKPDLRLTSDPPQPRGQLLLMLATGRSWANTETALSEGKLSADVLNDFLDFFIFSGEGSKLEETLGIKDITFHLDGQTRGIGVKKDLTRRAGIGYSVEESSAEADGRAVSQKLEGEYRITHSLSLDVERNFSRNRILDDAETPATPTTDDRILFKFKKSF